MKNIFVLYKIVNGVKKYLRYGKSVSDGVNRYALYYGNLIYFATRKEAETVRADFDEPTAWEIECFKPVK